METYTHKDYSYVNITEVSFDEIDLIDIVKLKEPRQSPVAYYKSLTKKPAVLTNGGYFNMSDGTTCMTAVDEGKVLSTSTVPSGMGIVGNSTLTLGPYTGKERDYLSAFPVLIEDGKAVASTYANANNYNTRRTIYAWTDTTLYVITVETPGMNYTKLKSVLLDMGVTNAVNLDGGGSAIKLVNGEKVTKQAYVRPVDTAIVIYLKPAKVIYRVQLGAFSKKANAEALLTKIKALPDKIAAGYANAYIRKIGLLYKVQVGAFSKRANAERVLADLSAQGYEAYITTK